MYLSKYTLLQHDIRALRLTDTYSLHRAVYGLFENIRHVEKCENKQTHSGILFVDKGGNAMQRNLLILSNRFPLTPSNGTLEVKEVPKQFWEKQIYNFEIIVNPVRRDSSSRKLIPLRKREEIAAWFCAKSSAWGFQVHEESLLVADIFVDTFIKNTHKVTLSKAHLTGILKVVNKELFSTKVGEGLGRGRAFGCGLLQIHPTN